MSSLDKKKIIAHLIEFFLIGLVMGVVEDLLAIHFATDAKITFNTLKVAFVVALPFAIISELVVDLKIIRRFLLGLLGKKRE
jgi:hypothetical protein